MQRPKTLCNSRKSCHPQRSRTEPCNNCASAQLASREPRNRFSNDCIERSQNPSWRTADCRYYPLIRGKPLGDLEVRTGRQKDNAFHVRGSTCCQHLMKLNAKRTSHRGPGTMLEFSQQRRRLIKEVCVAQACLQKKKTMRRSDFCSKRVGCLFLIPLSHSSRFAI